MSLATLEADMRDHPKWLALSAPAYRLGVRLVLWANKHSAERGFVPHYVVKEFAGTPRAGRALAGELVDCGQDMGKAGILTPTEGGYLVHDLITEDAASGTVWAAPEPLAPSERPRSDTGKLSRSDAGRLGGRRSAEVRRDANGSAQPSKQTTEALEANLPKQTGFASKQTPEANSGASGFASAGASGLAEDLTFQEDSGSSSLLGSSDLNPDPPKTPQPEAKLEAPEAQPAEAKVDSEAREKDPKVRAGVAKVFEAWRQDTGHHRAVLDRKRGKRIAARLREGFTPERLITAITNRRNDRFLMGENDTGRVYDDVETLLRDAAQVERLERLTVKPLRAQKAGGAPDGRASVGAVLARAERLREQERAEAAGAEGSS